MPRSAAVEIAASLAQRSDVEFAEVAVPRYALSPVAPTDPLYLSHQWTHARANVPAAWEVTTGSSSIKVAVIDSGFDVGHPDQPRNLELGCDFIAWREVELAGSCPVVSRDGDGHGTHVTGIISANWNGLAIAGIAPNVTVFSVRVLDDTGSGDSTLISDAIVHATDAGAQIINLSLGGTSNSQYEAAAIDYAVQRGALVIAAAGNCGAVTTSCPVADPIFYPAARSLTYPNAVIAVAATDTFDLPAPYSNAGTYVSVAAPAGAGVSAGASDWTTSLAPRQTGYLTTMEVGTSQAAPQVAAIAALALSVQPSLPRDTLGALIRSTARRDAGRGYPNSDFGYGIVDAGALVQAASAYATPTPTVTGTTTPATATATSTATPIATYTPTQRPEITSTSTATQVPRRDTTTTPTTTPTTVVGATPTPRSVSAAVTLDGGRLAADGNSVVIEIPAGALPSGARVEFSPRPTFDVAPLAGSRRITTFELSATDTLVGEVTIRIAVDAAALGTADPRSVRLYHVVDASGRRDLVPTQWLPLAGAIEARLRHFSSYEVATVQFRQLLPLGARLSLP